MAWVRLHDGAMTHPKVIGLSDKAFRLWVWGLSYSQQHLTDGQLPAVAIPSRLKRAVEELVTNRLWTPDPSGYAIHDYLVWNDSREVVTEKREAAKKRVTDWRNKQHTYAVRNGTSETLLARSGVGSSTAFQGKEREKNLEPDADALELRAGELLQRYGELFYQLRKGARYHARPALDFPKACELVRTWPDDGRLEKLARIVLTTDDEWIARTDRGFGIFAARASWADDRLRQAENGAA